MLNWRILIFCTLCLGTNGLIFRLTKISCVCASLSGTFKPSLPAILKAIFQWRIVSVVHGSYLLRVEKADPWVATFKDKCANNAQVA